MRAKCELLQPDIFHRLLQRETVAILESIRIEKFQVSLNSSLCFKDRNIFVENQSTISTDVRVTIFYGTQLPQIMYFIDHCLHVQLCATAAGAIPCSH